MCVEIRRLHVSDRLLFGEECDGRIDVRGRAGSLAGF